VSEGEEDKSISKDTYMFIFGFIFLYVTFTFFGASMDLAVVTSGLAIIAAFMILNPEAIKSILTFKPKVKKVERKVIDVKLVEEEGSK